MCHCDGFSLSWILLLLLLFPGLLVVMNKSARCITCVSDNNLLASARNWGVYVLLPFLASLVSLSLALAGWLWALLK